MDETYLQKLRASSKKWYDFLRNNPNENWGTIDTPEKFYQWAQTHPDKIQPEDLSEIVQSRESAKQLYTYETAQARSSVATLPRKVDTSPAAAIFMGPLLFLASHKEKRNQVKLAKEAIKNPLHSLSYNLESHLIKQNPHYLAYVNNLRRSKIHDWMRENPTKKWEDHQHDEKLQEYLNNNLYHEAETMFRNTPRHQDTIKGYQEQEKGKVYQNKKGKIDHNQDPVYQQHIQLRETAAKAVEDFVKQQKKEGAKIEYNPSEAATITKYQYDAEFAKQFPEKARAYSQTDPTLKASLHIIEEAEKEIQKESTQPQPTNPVIPTLPSQPPQTPPTPPPSSPPPSAPSTPPSTPPQPSSTSPTIPTPPIIPSTTTPLSIGSSTKNTPAQSSNSNAYPPRPIIPSLSFSRPLKGVNPFRKVSTPTQPVNLLGQPLITSRQKNLVNRLNRLFIPFKTRQNQSNQPQIRSLPPYSLPSQPIQSLPQNPISYFANVLSNLNTIVQTASPFSWKKYVYGAVAGFLILFFLMTFFFEGGAISALPLNSGPGTTTTSPTTPGTTTSTTPSSIAACSFYRAGDKSSSNPTGERKYQSPIVLSYFEEASRISGVPALVLAAFARIEYGPLADVTDANLSSFQCPENSSSGALGVMQLIPPPQISNKRPDAYTKEAIALGASYLQTTPEKLTRSDLCDTRKNIIIGAGFIVKKTNIVRGNPGGNTWKPEWTNSPDALKDLAIGYYGCDLYDSCTTGPYSYGQDLLNSVQACKVSTSSFTAASTPTPPSDIRKGIIDNFGITMNGFDNQHLQWAWEKFWEISNTNFNKFVRGSRIDANGTSGNSSQLGCFGGGVSIQLAQYQPAELFKFIIIHELGHVMQNCNTPDSIKYLDHKAALASEHGVSYYADHAATCTGSDNTSEDYADMVAYYLNPSAGLASSKCDPQLNPPNPFFGGTNTKPLHYNIMKALIGG